jgi:hypothetical protein
MDELVASSDPEAVGTFALGLVGLMVLWFAVRDRRRGHRVSPRGGRYGQRPPIGGFLVVCVLSLLGALVLAAGAGELVADRPPAVTEPGEGP